MSFLRLPKIDDPELDEPRLGIFPADPDGTESELGLPLLESLPREAGRPKGGGTLAKYTPEKYLKEKRDGKRLASGVEPLKRLTPRHIRILNLYISGASPSEICDELKVTHFTVWRTVNDPLAEPLLRKAYDARQKEMDALLGKAIDAVRVGLDSEETKEKLSAVGAYAKLKTTVAPETNQAQSAEDLAKAIIDRAKIENLNVQVNNYGERNAISN